MDWSDIFLHCSPFPSCLVVWSLASRRLACSVEVRVRYRVCSSRSLGALDRTRLLLCTGLSTEVLPIRCDFDWSAVLPRCDNFVRNGRNKRAKALEMFEKELTTGKLQDQISFAEAPSGKLLGIAHQIASYPVYKGDVCSRSP